MKILNILPFLLILTVPGCQKNSEPESNLFRDTMVSINLDLNLKDDGFIGMKCPTKGRDDECFVSGLSNYEIIEIIAYVFDNSTFYIDNGKDGSYGESFLYNK